MVISLMKLFFHCSIDNLRFEQLIATGQEFTDSDVILDFFSHDSITVELSASSVEFNQKPHLLLEMKQIDQQKKSALMRFNNSSGNQQEI